MSGDKAISGSSLVVNRNFINVNVEDTAKPFYIYIDNLEEKLIFPVAPAEDVYIVSSSGTHILSGDYTYTGTIRVPPPVVAADAATKGYVDSVVVSLDYKESARASGVGDVPLSGPSPLVVDGVTIDDGDRLLLFNQNSAPENGIYSIDDNGATYTLTRASDSVALTSGTFIYVTEGTANGAHSYVLATPDPIVMDITPLTFVVFGASTAYLAGNGLQLTATTFSVAATVSTGSFVASTAVSTPKITTAAPAIDFDASDINNIDTATATTVNAANINAVGATTLGNVANPITVAATTITVNAPTTINAATSATSLNTDTTLSFGTSDKITITPSGAIGAAKSYELPVVSGSTAAFPVVTGAPASSPAVLVSPGTIGNNIAVWQTTTLPPGAVTSFTTTSVTAGQTAATYPTAANTSAIFTIRVLAKVTATSATAGYEFFAATKNIAGTVTIGADLNGRFSYDTPFTGYDVAVAVSGTNLVVNVTPPVATAVVWKVWIDYYQS